MARSDRPMSLEESARRMTRLLARKPRKARTRALVASLPKRKPVIVTAADYPILTRAVARATGQQFVRDAQRYADWERRGKPPSPTIPPAPRKDRRRPRIAMLSRLLEAQDGYCGLCGHPLEVHEASLEHVVPRAKGGKNASNLLAAHFHCNNRKGDRSPTVRELERLRKVNERLAAG